jgi:hypothetical protein
MRFLLGLAWKNLSRYKKRTMITASAIAIGLGIFIFMDSWLLGLEQESERNLIWYESSYARILNEKYWEEKDQLPLEYVIEDPDAVVAKLREMNIPAAARTIDRLLVGRRPGCGSWFPNYDHYNDEGRLLPDYRCGDRGHHKLPQPGSQQELHIHASGHF